MTVSQVTPGKTLSDAEADVSPNRAGGPGLRARIGGIVLFLAITGALLAGGWGLLTSLAAESSPARVGESVQVPGGLLRVDKVTPEHMAPMKMGNFAKAGMNMSGMVMDMTPEGKRRFTVEVTLAGQTNGLSYSKKDFRISGEGVEQTAPLRSRLGSGEVPPGSAISGILVFQVPEEAENLRLGYRDGRPVLLDLAPGSQNKNKSHGGH